MNNGVPLPQKYVDELTRLMGTRGGTKKAVERTKVSRSTLERAAYGAGVLRTTHTAIVEFLDRVMSGAAKKSRSLDDYIEENRLRTRAALQVKRARGERAGTVPFGYQLAADGVHLEEHQAEQATIATVLELRAQGLSLRGIVAELERRGVTSRTGRGLGITQVYRICEKKINHPKSSPIDAQIWRQMVEDVAMLVGGDLTTDLSSDRRQNRRRLRTRSLSIILDQEELGTWVASVDGLPGAIARGRSPSRAIASVIPLVMQLVFYPLKNGDTPSSVMQRLSRPWHDENGIPTKSSRLDRGGFK